MHQLFQKIFKECIIYGCEARGDADKAYMTRYTLFAWKDWKVRLHHFHRSDADEMHNHPWHFWSLVLWGGYVEIYPTGKRLRLVGDLVFREADWAHRVELIEGLECWTLCLMTPYKKPWGFFTKQGWIPWKKYFEEKGCK